jgi:flavin reductase (DIM6/NTAB) family NADH-FMN oxidoreductase RutF
VRVAADELDGRQAYQWLIDTIVPRPVAWVTTVAWGGETNLAPFSFFSGVCARPPTISLAISTKAVRGPDGVRSFVPKDTLANAERTGAFVVHLARSADAAAVERCAEDHPVGTDVPSLLGLRTVPGTWVDVPRLPDAPAALECVVADIVPVGSPPTFLLLGEVRGFHVRDENVVDGRPRASTWDPLARLGVEGFARPR